MRRRIAIVPTWYPSPAHPGRGVFVREHARALASAADVVVIFPDPDARSAGAPWTVAEASEDGLRVLRVSVRWPGARVLGPALHVLGVRAALRRLRRSGWVPDVIHAHVFAAAIVALAARPRGVPVVVTEHYSGFRLGRVNGFDRRLARLAFSRADLVCPVSEELAGHLRAIGGTAPVRVVPNVIDVERFRPRDGPREPGPVRALVVAGLDEVKQIGVLLDALAAIRADAAAPPIELDVAGDGPLREPLRARARALGIEGAVRFLGRRSAGEVAELMRRADLFVLPSRTENLPVVLLEAQASGLPIVATRVGGVPEIVDAEAGVLVEPGDVAALAAAIADVAARLDAFDPAALHARASARYGRPAVIARQLAFYDALTRGAPVPT